MCYGFNKKCDNNIKRRSIFEGQHYTILTKVVDETIEVCFFQSHNKLSIVQPTLKEANSFPILHIIQCSSQIYTRNIKPNQMFSSCNPLY
jgi:hypothetical protein